jgi:hypothetical protein
VKTVHFIIARKQALSDNCILGFPEEISKQHYSDAGTDIK